MLNIDFIDREGANRAEVHDHPQFDFCLYVSCAYDKLDPNISTVTDPNVMMRLLNNFAESMESTKDELSQAVGKLKESTFGGETEIESGPAYLIFWAKTREDALLAKLTIG